MRVLTLRADGCLSHVLVAGREAAIIDPSRDTARYRKLLLELGAEARLVIDTHTHADHLSGARKLADETGARLAMSARYDEQWRAAEGQADALGIANILRANAGVRVDAALHDGDCLELGGEELRVVEAQGHTLDSIVLLTGPRAFTGDTLLIGQTGRADLPGGDPGRLYETLSGRLAALPDETFVYPGHDYQGQSVTALGFERVASPFLRPRSRDEFIAFLATAFPTLTGAGMQCGASASGPGAAPACGPGGEAGPAAAADHWRERVSGYMDSWFFGGAEAANEVEPAEALRALESGQVALLLDVREPAEFQAGHVPGALNLSVRELDRRLGEIPVGREAPIVTLCATGKRSGWATMFLRVAGFSKVRNLRGGMRAWEKAGLPTRPGTE